MGENGEYTKVAGNSGGGASSADKISYDNTQSGIEATNVQGAIDTIKAEFYEEIDHVNTSLEGCVKAPDASEGEIARIGDSLYVAEIDENGKPTKWAYEKPDPLAPIMNKDISELTYDEIATIVRAGRAEEKFKIGDQIVTTYTTTNGTQYEMPFDVVAFRKSELEDGSIVPSMIIQSHYATVESIQFDAPESSSSDINVRECGWNRWMYSGIRQWLNSDANKGAWWKSTHSGDVAPTQHGTYNGFMKGFSTDFLNILKKTKHETALNYAYPSGSSRPCVYDVTYDTFFLPSMKEEHCCNAANPYYWDDSDREGSTWEYWIQRKGEAPQKYSSSTGDINTNSIRYSLADKSTAKTVWLRSANRDYSSVEYNIRNSGNAIHYACFDSSSCSAPAAVIC